MVHHEFTAAEIAAGWRFAVWRNLGPDGKLPGGYVVEGGEVLKFERAEDALSALRRLGFEEHVGHEVPRREALKKGRGGKGNKKVAPAAPSLATKPTAYVCQFPPADRSCL